MNPTVLLILLIILLAIFGFFVLPQIRLRRAIKQVVAVFERNNALNAMSARTIDELKLKPRTFLQGIGRIRDFKPYALKMLMDAGIVCQTDGGRLYLAQDKLSAIDIDRR
jgi:hypothetical protein